MLTALEREAVREQTDRIVATSFFRHSKRYTEFLRYVVGYALANHSEPLKERTVGVTVFGLEPTYDTAQYPVVRMVAMETRKRLKKYYGASGRENEVRIELPCGSYLPEFSFPCDGSASLGGDQVLTPPQSSAGTRHRSLTLCVISLLVVVCILTSWKVFAQETALTSFWNPIVNSSSPILVCMPNPEDLIPLRQSLNSAQQSIVFPLLTLTPRRRNHASFSDSVALSSLVRLFGNRNGAFRVRRADEVTESDLLNSAAVLIGAFDNKWTLGLMGQMPFAFSLDGETEYIRNKQDPSFMEWSLSLTKNIRTDDYALISRSFRPATGNVLVIVAGLGSYGTEAAGQCVTDPVCLEQARKLAPGDWKRKNIQIVIRTSTINSSHGEPQVVAARVW